MSAHPMIRHPVIALAVMAVLWAAPLGAAEASASVRLGPDLTTTPNGNGYSSQEAYSPGSFFTEPTASPGIAVAAPSDGVITRWGFRGSCCLEAEEKDLYVTLRVFKNGPNDFGYGPTSQPVRSGGFFKLPAGENISADAVTEGPARLRIDSGEWPGINFDFPFAFASYSTANVTFGGVQPAVDDGAEGNVYRVANTALALSVVVEPDADEDGYGDETQDCAPTDPTQHPSCETALTPAPAPGNPLSVSKPSCTNCEPSGNAIVFGPPLPPASAPAPGGSFHEGLPPKPSTNGKSVIVSVTCPFTAPANCTGKVDVKLVKLSPVKKALAAAPAAKKRRRTVVLGRAAYSVRPGEAKKLRVKLSRTARKLLKRERRRAVIITLRPKGGEPESIRRTLTFPKQRSGQAETRRP